MEDGEEVYKCPFCDYECRALWSLIDHIRKTHIVGGYCPVCKKKFKNLGVHCYSKMFMDDMHALIFYVSKRGAKNTYVFMYARKKLEKIVKA